MTEDELKNCGEIELRKMVLDLQTVVEHHDMIQFSNSHECVRRGYEQLLAAIKEHHSQKADDRCIEDDYKLYAAAGLPPHDPHVGDKAAMMKNCVRFIENRCKSGKWPSYAELEHNLAEAIFWRDTYKNESEWMSRSIDLLIKLEYAAEMTLGNWTAQSQRDQLRLVLNEIRRHRNENKMSKVPGKGDHKEAGQGKAGGDPVPVQAVPGMGGCQKDEFQKLTSITRRVYPNDDLDENYV